MTSTDATPNAVTEDNVGDLDGEKKARWFRVYVNIFDDHALFDGEPYSRVTAWMWLIANAAWKTKKINHKGKIIELQRGQVLVGRAFLAKKWLWSEKKVRTFLALLESDNMIEMGQSNGHFANIATICNYGKYQDVPNKENQSTGQCWASDGPEKGQTLTKYTNTTNTQVASSLPEPARDDATPRCEDLKVFYDRLCDAASACLDNPANCQGLINTMIPQTWINSGCDLELDILPALRAKAATHKGRRVWSWDYFTNAVADARVKRLAASKRIATATVTSGARSAAGRAPTASPRLLHLNDESWKEQIANEMVEQGLANVIN